MSKENTFSRVLSQYDETHVQKIVGSVEAKMTASLLEAAKAGIADSKKYLYRHLEVSYNDCTPPHQSGRDYKVLQMHQAVAKALHEEGYQVRYESFPPERHDFGTTHIWTIYWGPSCPHCGKATG